MNIKNMLRNMLIAAALMGAGPKVASGEPKTPLEIASNKMGTSTVVPVTPQQLEEILGYFPLDSLNQVAVERCRENEDYAVVPFNINGGTAYFVKRCNDEGEEMVVVMGRKPGLWPFTKTEKTAYILETRGVKQDGYKDHSYEGAIKNTPNEPQTQIESRVGPSIKESRELRRNTTENTDEQRKIIYVPRQQDVRIIEELREQTNLRLGNLEEKLDSLRQHLKLSQQYADSATAENHQLIMAALEAVKIVNDYIKKEAEEKNRKGIVIINGLPYSSIDGKLFIAGLGVEGQGKSNSENLPTSLAAFTNLNFFYDLQNELYLNLGLSGGGKDFGNTLGIRERKENLYEISGALVIPIIVNLNEDRYFFQGDLGLLVKRSKGNYYVPFGNDGRIDVQYNQKENGFRLGGAFGSLGGPFLRFDYRHLGGINEVRTSNPEVNPTIINVSDDNLEVSLVIPFLGDRLGLTLNGGYGRSVYNSNNNGRVFNRVETTSEIGAGLYFGNNYVRSNLQVGVKNVGEIQAPYGKLELLVVPYEGGAKK